MKEHFITNVSCVLISVFMIVCVIYVFVRWNSVYNYMFNYDEDLNTVEGFTQFIPPILSQYIPPSIKRSMHPQYRKMRLHLEKRYGENNIALNRFLRKSGFY